MKESERVPQVGDEVAVVIQDDGGDNIVAQPAVIKKVLKYMKLSRRWKVEVQRKEIVRTDYVMFCEDLVAWRTTAY